jgi:amino acid permease
MMSDIEFASPLIQKEPLRKDSLLGKGSANSAALNLMAATMGAGTVTMPYIFTRVGIVPASILIIIGAFLSHYSSMLLVKCTCPSGRGLLICINSYVVSHS